MMNNQLDANLRNCSITSKYLRMVIGKNSYIGEIKSERPIITPDLVFNNYFVLEGFVSFPRLQKVTPSILENALRKIFNTVEVPEDKLVTFAGFSFDFSKIISRIAYKNLLELCLVDMEKVKNSTGWAQYLQDMYINTTVNKTAKKKTKGAKIAKKGVVKRQVNPWGTYQEFKYSKSTGKLSGLLDVNELPTTSQPPSYYMTDQEVAEAIKPPSYWTSYTSRVGTITRAGKEKSEYVASYYKILEDQILYGTPEPTKDDLTPEAMNESKKEEGQL